MSSRNALKRRAETFLHRVETSTVSERPGSVVGGDDDNDAPFRRAFEASDVDADADDGDAQAIASAAHAANLQAMLISQGGQG